MPNTNINSQPDVLLIHPPVRDFYQTQFRLQPLGLEYLCSVLQKNGFNTHILDCLAEPVRQTIPLPPKMTYLRPHYPTGDLSPFRAFGHYYHFGMSLDTIRDNLRLVKPRIIGISANFTPYFEMTVAVARLCKSMYPTVPVIVGGHHATAAPDFVLQESSIDYVVLAEGEQAFPILVKYLLGRSNLSLEQINGIAYRENGNTVIRPQTQLIQELDALPFPQTTSAHSNSRMILTSRGCPKNCRFCSIRNVMGQKTRYRSLENVFAEIDFWYRQGIREFDFEDDNLTLNKPRAKRLFAGLLERYPEGALSLSALNGLSAVQLDWDLLNLMKKAGVCWLNVPLVSGDSQMQHHLDRDQPRGPYFDFLEMAGKLEFRVVGYLILGLPDDTLENMLTDILDLASARVLIGPSLFYPPPGTPIFDKCIEQQLIRPNDFSLFRSTAVSVETKQFSRTDIITLFRLTRLLNYMKALVDEGCFSEISLDDYLNTAPKWPALFDSPQRLSAPLIGQYLLAEFFCNHNLTGLRIKTHVQGKFQYQRISYPVSSALVETTLTRLEGRNIRGVGSENFVVLKDF
ncbi:B12-binding domain-containing radical SAM protein [bacterium]|nr:B12-binding domain-containing radical SAM protein [bacterium]